MAPESCKTWSDDTAARIVDRMKRTYELSDGVSAASVTTADGRLIVVDGQVEVDPKADANLALALELHPKIQVSSKPKQTEAPKEKSSAAESAERKVENS